MAEQLCRDKGWTLSRLERDEGVSGWDGSNVSSGALGEFVKAVQSGRIETPCVLIVESLDRLSRQPTMRAFDLFRMLISLGVTICTADTRTEYSAANMDELGPLLMSLTQMASAHQFSQTLSRRLRSSWSSKKAKAQKEGKILTKKVPAWIIVPEKATETKSFRVDEERANVVRRIFREFLSGKGVNSIALGLTKDGIKPFGRSKVWNVSTVNRWIRSKTVLGHLQSCTYVRRNVRKEDNLLIEAYYPAIVSEKDFYAAQQLRNERLIPRGPKRNRHNLFSGLLFCKRCGNGVAMKTGAISKKRNSPYRAVVCSNAMRGGECKYAKVPYVHFEEIVLQVMFAKLIGSMEPFENTAEAKIRSIEGELRNIEQRLAVFERSLNDQSITEIPRTMIEAMKGLENRHEQLLAAKKSVPEDFGERRIVELVRNWQPIENNEENRSHVAHLLSLLIERIQIDAIAQKAEISLRSENAKAINEISWDKKDRSKFTINGISLPKAPSRVWLGSHTTIDASKLTQISGPAPAIEAAFEYRVALKIGKTLHPYRCIHGPDGCEYVEILTTDEVEKGRIAKRFKDSSPDVAIDN
jgi:DNA invertase Pin-like site-specific DNA recombinase